MIALILIGFLIFVALVMLIVVLDHYLAIISERLKNGG